MNVDALGAVDWGAVSAITAVVVGVPVIAGWIATRVTRWRTKHATGDDDADRLWTAIFGRPAKPPYPAITGLVEDHARDHVRLFGDPATPGDTGLAGDHERRISALEGKRRQGGGPTPGRPGG